jgi:DNA-binding response OmpR family regulator
MPESVRLLRDGSDGTVLRGLELLFSGEAGVEVVGRADDADSAIRLGRELRPSTVLIDLESMGERGLQVAAEVKPQVPAKVVVLSLRDDRESRQRADEAGLRFVSKQAGSDSLLALLREISRLDPSLQAASTAVPGDCRPCGRGGAPRDQRGSRCGQRGAPWKLGVSTRLEANFEPSRIQNERRTLPR